MKKAKRMNGYNKSVTDRGYLKKIMQEMREAKRNELNKQLRKEEIEQNS